MKRHRARIVLDALILCAVAQHLATGAAAAAKHVDLSAIGIGIQHAPQLSNASLDLPNYTPIGAGGPPAFDTSNLLMLGAKFAVVLLLLFICLRVLRSISPKLQGAGGKPGSMVLHSETVGEKQRVCLLDLHGRLMLVGVSNGGVTPITTVEDAEAIESLRAQYGSRQASAAPTARQRRMQEPSFAAALSAEYAAGGDEPRRQPTTARTLVQPQAVPSAKRVGDPQLGRALAAIRSLRQRAEHA